MNIGEWLLDLLFPPKCPFCEKVLDAQGICPVCEKTLSWTAGTEREQTLPGGVRCASPLWYEDAAREGILRYKFHGVPGAAEPLGGLLADCAAEAYSGEFDTVAWVPVSRGRLRARGYDQARLLAESCCRRWSTKPLPLLKKQLNNPAQSGLPDAAARRANVLGMYKADGTLAAGKRILLIDDIVTTGATLCECARELKASGAADVLCLTLARTREKRKESGKNRCEVCENT